MVKFLSINGMNVLDIRELKTDVINKGRNTYKDEYTSANKKKD